ncbi:prepilin-type N-terminal cleavage/methylation domain-containing protein [bacterium]|nr:prepilin-type N-terminal cleavage/methylation domain-containing protein [bacterium]
MKRRRGLSLIELVVALMVGAVVTTLVVSMVAGGLAMTRRFLGEETVFRRAHVIVARLANLIHEADLNQATADQDMLAFPRARDGSDKFVTNATTGDPVWQGSWLVYRQSNQLRLLSLAPEQTGKLPAGANLLRPLANGDGEVLAKDLQSLQFNIETVDCIYDPVVPHQRPPSTHAVPAIVHLSFSLQFRNQRGGFSTFDFTDRLEGWNSFGPQAPDILPTPTTTPTPPFEMPNTANDWKDN